MLSKRLSCSVLYGWKQLQPNIEGTEEPLFRAQNRCIGVQIREVYDGVNADYAYSDRIDR